MRYQIGKLLWLVPIAAATYFLVQLQPIISPLPAPSKIEKPVPAPQKPEAQNIDELTIESLRTEITELEARLQKREEILNQRQRSRKPKADGPSLARPGLPPDQWSNKGLSRPEESVETLLWAGASGNLDTMANALSLDETATLLAEELFAQLPPDIQTEYQTPERIIALTTIDKIPLAQTKISSQITPTDDSSTIGLQISSNIESPQFVKLNLVKAESGDWKIAIPPGAILDYADSLGIRLD